MKRKKGISLIVLVITIIVIIILATAVIVTIATNNPIKEANKAKYESDRDSMQSVFTNTVAKVMSQNQGNIKITEGQINLQTTGVDKTTGEVNYTIEDPADSKNAKGVIVFDQGTNEATKYYTGKQLPIYKAGETKWYVDEDGVISLEVNGVKYGDGNTTGNITPPVVEETLKAGEIATKTKNKFKDNDGNTATIPIDFIVVPGCETISKGLVISDDVNDTEVDKQEDGSGIVAEGNQFVWVPVNDMSTFVREEGYSNGNLQNGLQDCSEPLNYDGIEASEEEKEMYNNMMASVEKYKGFYMGRYEASNDGNDHAQSKKNKVAWVQIPWEYSMSENALAGGAVEKARAVYPKSNATTGKAISILPFGVQWDETVRFLKKNYPGIEKDSKEYGNYYEDGIYDLKTGNIEKNALNNIYDMAGNAFEWTMEAFQSQERSTRGGDLNNSGIYSPVSYRSGGISEHDYTSIGFRLALYISL